MVGIGSLELLGGNALGMLLGLCNEGGLDCFIGVLGASSIDRGRGVLIQVRGGYRRVIFWFDNSRDRQKDNKVVVLKREN